MGPPIGGEWKVLIIGEIDARRVLALRDQLPLYAEHSNVVFTALAEPEHERGLTRIQVPEHGSTTITKRLQDIFPGCVSQDHCQECTEKLYPEYRRRRDD